MSSAPATCMHPTTSFTGSRAAGSGSESDLQAASSLCMWPRTDSASSGCCLGIGPPPCLTCRGSLCDALTGHLDACSYLTGQVSLEGGHRVDLEACQRQTGLCMRGDVRSGGRTSAGLLACSGQAGRCHRDVPVEMHDAMNKHVSDVMHKHVSDALLTKYKLYFIITYVYYRKV